MMIFSRSRRRKVAKMMWSVSSRLISALPCKEEVCGQGAFCFNCQIRLTLLNAMLELRGEENGGIIE